MLLIDIRNIIRTAWNIPEHIANTPDPRMLVRKMGNRLFISHTLAYNSDNISRTITEVQN